MDKAIEWVKRRKTLVAVIVGAFAVLKAIRWLAGLAWSVRQFVSLEDIASWTLGHWLVVAAILGAVFVAGFAATRAAIGWLGRRGRRAKSDSDAEDQPASPSREAPVVAGNPLEVGRSSGSTSRQVEPADPLEVGRSSDSEDRRVEPATRSRWERRPSQRIAAPSRRA
jgi:hypothetical protein